MSFPRHSEGRWQILNIWATWCPPCVKELPSLRVLAASLEGVAVDVVAISVDKGGPAVVRSFLRRQRIVHPDVKIEIGETLLNSIGANGLPVTVIVNPAGAVTHLVRGAWDWDDPKIARELRALIGP